MSSEKDNLTKELDSKLEDLFDEDTLDNDNSDDFSGEQNNPEFADIKNEKNTSPGSESESDKGSADVSPKPYQAKDEKKTEFPLDNLNAILLSLDWEITDELINGYILEIEKLKSKYSDDKYSDYFLRILENLGRYIQKNLGAAHPESVTMMQTIHSGLEAIFLDSEMSELKKKKIFYKEYNKYIRFKHKISLKKAGKKSGKSSSVETEKFAEEFIARISESLRKVVRQELEKVKKEILESVENKK
ncbi:MAG: hypothetical protein ACQEQS_02220 [Thermodesulfobacteriota bacterium]